MIFDKSPSYFAYDKTNLLKGYNLIDDVWIKFNYLDEKDFHIGIKVSHDINV